MPKTCLPLRIVILDPPPGVAFTVRCGCDGMLLPKRKSADRIVFELDAQVDIAPEHPARLTGKCVWGPPTARFIYINAGTFAGQTDSCWSRRAKIPLAGIAPAAMQTVLHDPRQLLETQIRGTARDGGPACASVPLLSEWQPAERDNS